MTLKLLTEQHLQFLSLNEGCSDSSESTLIKVPHCWKSHVAAQLCIDGSNKETVRKVETAFGDFY